LTEVLSEVVQRQRKDMRPRTSSAIDGESLQADVMRFMAIIAFCLVAIMALVRDVVPASEPAQIAPAEIAHMPLQQQKPLLQPQKPEQPKIDKPPAPSVALPDPVQAMPVVSEPIPREPIVAALPFAPPTTVPEIPELQIAEAAPPDPVDEPGLSLRFGSDQDFLRLIAKGSVGVFLFDAQNVYELEQDYSFERSAPPGKLYELMPETIPHAIRASANNAVGDSAAFSWGVVMPERIARRIAALVAVERSGQLVINHYGEVQHRTTQSRSLAGG